MIDDDVDGGVVGVVARVERDGDVCLFVYCFVCF